MASPWLNQPCPHVSCGRVIRDLLAEMVPNKEHTTPEFKAIVLEQPGGAITCPFCQGSLEYEVDGKTVICSPRIPLRYSRIKMEIRARDFGRTLMVPPRPNMNPEEWIAEEKVMPGALQGYQYAEDLKP